MAPDGGVGVRREDCPYCALVTLDGERACSQHQPAKGWRAPQVCQAAGVSYRQLDYWTVTGLVKASIREAHGTGTQRLYSDDDVAEVATIARLLDDGMSLQAVRRLDDEQRYRLAAFFDHIHDRQETA